MTTLEALRTVLAIAEQNAEPKSIVGSNQEREKIRNAIRLIRALADAVV